MLAKAVAHHTTASFIRVVGSEFVQKYLGEGPRMVRDVFRLAKENAPAVIFIDEVDAIATKRFDAQTGADREVQRILMELLTQMDGFDQSVNVKVIMCTNRADTLDPALLRPGRLDRKIEFPQPGRREKRLIFQVSCAQSTRTLPSASRGRALCGGALVRPLSFVRSRQPMRDGGCRAFPATRRPPRWMCARRCSPPA
jgi:26S proteasome regulatory subunit T3